MQTRKATLQNYANLKSFHYQFREILRDMYMMSTTYEIQLWCNLIMLMNWQPFLISNKLCTGSNNILQCTFQLRWCGGFKGHMKLVFDIMLCHICDPVSQKGTYKALIITLLFVCLYTTIIGGSYCLENFNNYCAIYGV